MKEEYVRRNELFEEVVREDLLKNQAYYRQKGKRFTENHSGLMMLSKPGPPEMWAAGLPNVHRIDKAHLVMLIEENLVPRNEGIKNLLAIKELEKENVTKERIKVGGGIYSGENYLIQRFGENIGGLIHLGRSTGDLIGGYSRMYIRSALLDVIEEAIKYRESLLTLAEEHVETPFPTYTALQEAQVTSFGHYLLDFLYKAAHGCTKMKEAYKEVNRSPMGAAIGTGSDFPLNRERTAELLGFDEVITNTHEAVSTENKTFIIETFCSLILLLSSVEKLSSFLYYFHTNEFGMIRVADRHCATSSIMPHKRNPNLLFAVGEKIHSVYSLFVRNLFDETAAMSWPRGAALYAALEDVEMALITARANISTVKVNKAKVNEHLMKNWTCATDLAGALVKESNLSWRTAHQIVSILVRHAEEEGIPAKELNNKMIEEAAMEHMGRRLTIRKNTIKRVLDPMEQIKARTLTGGPAPENVIKQVQEIKRGLGVDRKFIQAARKKLKNADVKLDNAVDKLCKEKV